MFTKISFFMAAVLMNIAAIAQTELEEKKPQTIDGIEYGYFIKNEQIKNVKDEEYARFEITVYAINKTGCTKLYADKTSLSASDANVITSFNCSNANGKRLTVKSGNIKAKDFYVNAKVQENGKEVNRTVKAGYIFRNGETLRTNIIVLVPKGERPVMQCSANYLPEL